LYTFVSVAGCRSGVWSTTGVGASVSTLMRQRSRGSFICRSVGIADAARIHVFAGRDLRTADGQRQPACPARRFRLIA
jgi:hypothetical protein